MRRFERSESRLYSAASAREAGAFAHAEASTLNFYHISKHPLTCLKLDETDKKYLSELLSKGQVKARVLRRATGLLQLDQGSTLQNVAKILGVDDNTVAIWRNKYLESGLNFLPDQPRSGRPIKFGGEQRAKVTALACSETPDGRAKWSLQLLADKVVELGFCESISPSKVRDMAFSKNSGDVSGSGEDHRHS